MACPVAPSSQGPLCNIRSCHIAHHYLLISTQLNGVSHSDRSTERVENVFQASLWRRLPNVDETNARLRYGCQSSDAAPIVSHYPGSSVMEMDAWPGSCRVKQHCMNNVDIGDKGNLDSLLLVGVGGMYALIHHDRALFVFVVQTASCILIRSSFDPIIGARWSEKGGASMSPSYSPLKNEPIGGGV